MAGRSSGGFSWDWLSAAGLLVATGTLSVLSPLVLVGIPLALLALFLSPRRAAALVVGLGVTLAVLGGDQGSGLWFLERGWAVVLGGWFVALTLRWPTLGFVPRGLGAVAGTFGVMGAHFWSRAGEWAVVDWAVTNRMEAGMGMALQAIRTSLGPQAVSEAMEARALEAMALQGLLFPAFLGLASLSALAFAWWLHGRLARSGEEGIGPLKEFRFNDQLVWVLIGGLMFLLVASGALERLGTNAFVFMGGLYALRGLAVVLFLTGGVSLFGGILLVMGLFFLAPLFLGGAFVIGLGDTWLNLRARRGASSPS